MHIQMKHCEKRRGEGGARLLNHAPQNSARNYFECLHVDCKESFNCVISLKKHAVEHLEKPELLCVKCGEVCLSTFSLHVHECHAHQIPDSKPAVIWGLDKSLTCQFCGMHTATLALFDIHVERHRTQSEQVVKCTLGGCKNPFYAPNDLRLHVILSHLVGDADNFVHACEYPECFSDFVSVASLSVYKQEAHGESDELGVDAATVPFACMDIKKEIDDP
jgi:hypothetical protein